MSTTVATSEAAWPASLPRKLGYRGLLGLSALAAGLFGGSLLFAGWFSTADGGSHRFHELSWGVIEGAVVLVGLIGSLWRPTRRPAAYQQVAVGLVALLATMVMIREIDVATLVVAGSIAIGGLLHPAREQLRRVGPWDGPGLLVAAVTAAPLVWYAIGEAALHRTGAAGDPHVEMAHYAGTAAAALAVAGLAVLSASRRPGQRVVCLSAVLGLTVLGTASLLWPDTTSSFGTAGGSAALAAALAVGVTGLRRPADPDRPGTRRGATATTLVLALGLLGAACSDEPGPASNAAEVDPGEAAPDEGADASVEVRGVDHAFDGVPEEVATGTELTFTNASDEEVHELIVMRIDDAETRPLEELLALPESEVERSTEYVGMQVALPGEDGTDPEDPDASRGVTLDEPGRYALLCFIPEGAEVQAYRDVLEGDAAGPPAVEGGPPHAALGMATEVTVTG